MQRPKLCNVPTQYLCDLRGQYSDRTYALCLSGKGLAFDQDDDLVQFGWVPVGYW